MTEDTHMIDRKIFLYLAGVALGSGIIGGALTGRVLRTEARVERVTETARVVKRVQRIETVEYLPVAKITAPPLDDPKQACSGAPVRIVTMSTDTVDDKARTWVVVQPVGDAYTVTCMKSGYYLDSWRVGMTIRMFNGEIGA